MLVVADASPLVGLVKIGHADVLGAVYGSVLIPPRVASELASLKRPAEVRAFMASPPRWLSVRAPSRLEAIDDLEPGELEAISLAKEIGADLLLIDEAKGRAAAIALHIPTARTAAILFDAANAGMVPDLKSAFDRLPRHDLPRSGKGAGRAACPPPSSEEPQALAPRS
jgi:predicted nucleic acid-binding protein